MQRRTALGLLVGLAGCLGGVPRPPTRRDDHTDVRTPPLDPETTVGYTHVRPSGNRLASVPGSVPTADPVDVSLPTTPAWVVGVPDGATTVWVVVLVDGSVRAYRIAPDGVTGSVAVDAAGEGPPLVGLADGTLRALATRSLTHPLPVADGFATVDGDGLLVLPSGTLAVDALPDARVVTDGERLYVHGRATDAYAHGVLGDAVEAGGIAVVDPASPAVTAWLDPPAGAVFEGIAPLVADWAGGTAVVATASDGDAGARVVVYDPDGSIRATGPAVGRGFRWRHQIAVAPFAPDGSLEVAAVRTPHLGGTVEFARLDGEALRTVARTDGYASHRIGSRNLDMAVAGDFEGDGRVELLVPTDPMDALAGLRRTDGGVEEAWRVPLGGRLTTNLGVAGGTVAAGWDGTLRVWTD